MNYNQAILATEVTDIDPVSIWNWIIQPTAYRKRELGAPSIQPRYNAQALGEPQVKQRFRELAQQWEEETLNVSSLTEIFSHEAYLAIIALGRPVLPFLFSELDQRPNFWFTAISSILLANNEYADVVREEDYGNLQKMTDAWVEWGKEQSYLD